jgi:hypothetical protein
LEQYWHRFERLLIPARRRCSSFTMSIGLFSSTNLVRVRGPPQIALVKNECRQWPHRWQGGLPGWTSQRRKGCYEEVSLKFASSYASAPLPPQPTLAAWADSSLVRSIHFCSLPHRYPARCCDHLPRPRCRLEALSVQDAAQDVFRTRPGHTSSREDEG